MKQTDNLKLRLYDSDDLMNITGPTNSLNHNMEIIDEAINGLQQVTSDTQKELTTQSDRIDNLVLNSGDSSTEVIDARVDADGKTYSSLRERLNTESSELKSDIESMPDDVVNIHIWEKFRTELKIELSEKAEKSLYAWPSGMGATYNTNIDYSQSIGRSDGNIVLEEPVMTINYKTNESVESLYILRGKYIMSNGVYWIPEDATFSVKDDTGGLSLRKVVCNGAQAVNDVSYDKSLGFVTSKSRNTYPDVGQSGENRYEYRGTIGQAISKIVTL